MDIPLVESASVTLNGSGNGTIQLGPARSRDTWKIDSIAVNCSTNVREAQTKIYVGQAVAQRSFVDGTFMGSSGDTTDTVNKTVRAGEFVFCVFAAGDAGAVASVIIYGTKTVQ